MGNVVIGVNSPSNTVILEGSTILEDRGLIVSSTVVQGGTGPQGPQGPRIYVEPVVIAGFNLSITHSNPIYNVPMFVTTTDGDIITAEV